MTVKGTMNTTMENMIKTLSSCQSSFKCSTAASRPPLSALGSSDLEDEVADEMGSEEDLEPRWSDSGDLSCTIAYGLLTALDRFPESFHLSFSSSSSPILSAT